MTSATAASTAAPLAVSPIQSSIILAARIVAMGLTLDIPVYFGAEAGGGAAARLGPRVSRRTFGFSMRVTDFRPYLRAKSKAARTIRAQADLVMIRVDRAISLAGASLKRFVLGVGRSASRTTWGRGKNSTPAYMPSVFSRKMTRPMPSL